MEEVQVMMVGPHRIQDTEIIFLFYYIPTILLNIFCLNFLPLVFPSESANFINVPSNTTLIVLTRTFIQL